MKRNQKGQFIKGASGNPHGVGKGLKQKSTQVKEAFFTAFEESGGVEGLIKWVKQSPDNRKDFYSLLVRLMPKEIESDLDITLNESPWPDRTIIFSDSIDEEITESDYELPEQEKKAFPVKEPTEPKQTKTNGNQQVQKTSKQAENRLDKKKALSQSQANSENKKPSGWRCV